LGVFVVDPEVGLPLSDLIEAVREELQAAAMVAKGSGLQFEVDDVTLQVQVTATGSRGVEGGVKLWAVNLGGRASKSDASMHTVTLKMTAVTPSGNRFSVSELSSEDVRRQ
jgi:hypothetical protein